MGGTGPLVDLADAEVFDPSTDTWSPWPFPMSHTRATHVMRDLGDGRFLLVGGSNADMRPEVFSTSTGTFTPMAAPASELARFGAAGASFPDGDVCIAGGDSLGSVLHFDRQASTILNTSSGLARARAYGTVSPIGPGRMLVVGGIDFGQGLVLTSCDLIVQGGLAGSRTYVTTLGFPTPMANHTATVLGDGRVLFTGGLNPTNGLPEFDGAYVFTP